MEPRLFMPVILCVCFTYVESVAVKKKICGGVEKKMAMLKIQFSKKSSVCNVVELQFYPCLKGNNWKMRKASKKNHS